ncbi:xanthine dehydrogenase accessory factor [Desulfotomaculum arcticum]|uniref:Xanthine dehydrogenase accessory factor n=1 Tax=Desulfotruncus arcticus DSM 17038 TaxID=1121424 RepID=A0A1I2QP66_9FIRM|nr:XdhC/CoxI family protein [Desulfotruncus arcticus]SFG30174.1 xanthine dehydrogenase accessory factor [Desulfotomaculum arcticum] [Desulfotruncus arcticus DSM 17038]
MIKIYQDILRLLEQGESFVLATILANYGSTPRTAGSKMIVRRDGSIIGTIGGGLVEARVIEMAPQVMKTQNALVREFNLNSEIAGQMDMICGGHLKVLLDYISAEEAILHDIYRALGDAVAARRKAVLVSPVPDGDAAAFAGRQCLVVEGGRRAATFILEPAVLDELLRAANSRYPQVVVAGGRSYLVEQISDYGTVYIFGAGHVSLQVARLAKTVDFVTVVLDDRAEFANKARFPLADRVEVLPSFDQELAELGVDEDSYVVIVTRGHAHDKTVLARALRAKACYIGMIGSKRKRDTIYEALENEGFSRSELARVHSPIGLSINAETPEEIAVSIMAELIKVRAEHVQ